MEEPIERGWARAVSGATLALTVRAAGLVMVLRSVKLALFHAGFFASSDMLFAYWGWGWLPRPPGEGVRVLLGAAALGGGMMLLGSARVARAGTWLAWISFSYFFLLDKSFFGSVNYFLVQLLLALLVVRAWRTLEPTRREVAAPLLWLPRVILALLYFYAGVVKLAPDWLCGEVLKRFVMEAQMSEALMAWVMTRPALLSLSWGGALFDLLIGPLLLWPRTRKAVLVVALLFHFTNVTLVGIWEAPLYLGLSTLALFLPDETARRLLRWPAETPDAEARAAKTPRWQRAMIVALLVFHVVFPLRPYLMPGDSRWNRNAQDMSWWLRSTESVTTAKFYLSIDGGEREKIEVARYIDVQEQQLFASDPYLIVQFAHHVAARQRELHPEARTIAIHADVRSRLNNRAERPLIRPEVDLASAPLSLDMSWLTPPPAPAAHCWR